MKDMLIKLSFFVLLHFLKNDDEIYDTPEDAKKIQFMIDSRERKQDSCSDGNGRAIFSTL